MRTLVVLTRAPVAGGGKTRLRFDVDGDTVDRLASAFLMDTLSWAGRLDARLLIAHRGPAAAMPFVEGAVMVGQADGDLGARVEAAVEAAFAHGADRALLVGSDSPTLPIAILRRCFAELDGHDAALVPAADGGWVALGLREPLSGCLAGVSWSTSGTSAQTIAGLRSAGRQTSVLPIWYDVDTVSGLTRLRAELIRTPSRAPHTAAVLRSLG